MDRWKAKEEIHSNQVIRKQAGPWKMNTKNMKKFQKEELGQQRFQKWEGLHYTPETRALLKLAGHGGAGG